jgi:TonB family protein
MTEDTLIESLRTSTRALPIRPPASVGELLRVEQQLDLRFPTLLSRLYLEVADGNFGPGSGLFPLTGTPSSLVSETLDKRDLVSDVGEPWRKNLLCICTFGCTFYAGVDCGDDRGAVYLFEEHHGVNDTELGKTWHVKGPQFAPKLVKRVAPVYSEELRAKQIDGPVYLDALIDRNGNVVEVRIRESPDAELAQAASAAVRQWKFSPKIVDGASVPVLFELIVNFKRN